VKGSTAKASTVKATVKGSTVKGSTVKGSTVKGSTGDPAIEVRSWYTNSGALKAPGTKAVRISEPHEGLKASKNARDFTP